MHDPLVNISAPVSSRASNPESLVDECLVFGCSAMKHNVCLSVLDPALRAAVECNVALVAAWCDSLGSGVANEAQSVLWLHGHSTPNADGQSEPNDLAVLLVYCRNKPKVQYFCRLALADRPSETVFDMPGQFPFFLRIATRTSRLSAKFREVDLCTVDELGLCMAQLSLHPWSAVPLGTQAAISDNLMTIEVLGSDEEFRRGAKRRNLRVNSVIPLVIFPRVRPNILMR